MKNIDNEGKSTQRPIERPTLPPNKPYEQRDAPPMPQTPKPSKPAEKK